jgi:hypothetical protein
VTGTQAISLASSVAERIVGAFLVGEKIYNVQYHTGSPMRNRRQILLEALII